VNRTLRAVPGSGGGSRSVRNQPPDAAGESVRGDFPAAWGGNEYLTLNFAQAADGIVPWGMNIATRDRQLREFWPTEPLFAGALFTKISQYTTLDYIIEGPKDQTDRVYEMLESCEDGAGWHAMLEKFLNDLFTQDNGAFLELVREADDPYSPMVTMNHLDSACCVRTGNRQEPIIYIDSFTGVQHKLKWYQVLQMTEMPSPIARLRGAQHCVLTRLLTAAQIMKNIETFHREKTAGQFNKEVHFVGGIAKKQIEDSLRREQFANEQQGLVRFAPAVIIAGLDPTRSVSLQTIEFAKLPEGFDLESWLHYYFTQFALAWGGDYQDFAPIMSRGMSSGGSGQSAALHTKARGKGLGLFMQRMGHAFNWHGIMPRTCEFKYGAQDELADLDLANVRKARAQERQIRVMSGEITPKLAGQIAYDQGDLTEEEWNDLQKDPDRVSVLPQKFPGGPNTMADGQLPSPAGGKQPDGGPGADLVANGGRNKSVVDDAIATIESLVRGVAEASVGSDA
jgi:hypothetical protein